jgi:PEGA domain-containing protein
MRGTVAVIVLAGAIGGVLAGGRTARASAEEDALVRRAIELRKQGNDRAALEELKRAYLIARSPRAAAQLGFAEQALGFWPQAEEHVREALSSHDDPWIRKNRATLADALTTIRAHVGRIQIEGGEPGAQVNVNGQPVGSMPLRDAVPVSAGSVDIEVRAAGYVPALKTINVAGGEYTRVPFTLQPAARRGPPPPAPIVTAPAPRAPVTEPPVLLTEPPRDTGRGRRIAGVSLIAGGVAVIGGGVAASVVAKNKFDAIRADAAADRPYNEANGNWKRYETAATAAYVIGGGALIGGVVLYVTGRSRTEDGREPAVRSISLRPTYLGGKPGASLAVRF